MPWRILSVFAGPTLEAALIGDEKACGGIEEMSSLRGSHAEVKIMRSPTVDEFQHELQSWAPNFVYLAGGCQEADGDDLVEAAVGSVQFPTLSSSGEVCVLDADGFAALFCPGNQLEAVFLDAASSEDQAAALCSVGVPNIVYWPKDTSPNALVADQFSRAFFAMLRSHSVQVPEAFAVASHAVQVHLTAGGAGSGLGPQQQPEQQAPVMPQLYSAVQPALPGVASVPPPDLPGIDASQGLAAAVPGWEHVRLLAPCAELRLLACGRSNLIDVQRLSNLGEALRALLVVEVRGLTVAGMTPTDKIPGHLPRGCSALHCDVRTVSGAATRVVLGGPPEVLGNQALVEYALRQTLAADALSQQVKLPAPMGGAWALPEPRTTEGVAGGTPVVDVLLLTSVWAVNVLSGLAQDRGYRGLLSLGIAAVGATPVAGYTAADVQRMAAVVDAVGNPALAAPSAVPAPAASHDARHANGDGAYSDGGAQQARSSGGGPRKAHQEMTFVMPVGPIEWHSKRPPLTECTEEQFYADLIAFLTWRRGKAIDAAAFPDAVLNQRRLDLFSLYREVTSRGGFRVGNGINWKGQVFTAMRNFTEQHKMTGVGNALKRHYQLYLLEYEVANPGDIKRDVCVLCHQGEEAACDWVCCDSCDSWVHFSCDPRPGLGAFKDYSLGDSKAYYCGNCDADGSKRRRTS